MQWNPIPKDEFLHQLKMPELRDPLSPQQCMELAYHIAWQGLGFVYQNPLVGAVVVDKDHRFLAAAAHLKFGEEHAEVRLVQALREKNLLHHLKDATLYVTLEPCSHQGKTKPCVDLLLSLPIKKVIYGCVDPNPLVHGQGVKKLEEKGITCENPVFFQNMVRDLISHFKHFISHRRPFVGLKVACTLNAISAKNGDKRAWLTSLRARQYGHWLRQRYDAILVGAQTVIQDNPTLIVDHPFIQTPRDPLRIVFDPHGRALKFRPLKNTQLLHPSKNSQSLQTLWVCSEFFWQSPAGKKAKHEVEALGAETLGLELDPISKQITDFEKIQFDIHRFLQVLADRGLPSLLLEGGTGVWGAFLKAGAVHQTHVFLAPKIFSFEDSISWSQEYMGGDGQHLSCHDIVLTALDDTLLYEGLLSRNL